ncbi:MAG: hypothetical protein AAFX87_15215 [Bacteroidota bacterium]
MKNLVFTLLALVSSLSGVLACDCNDMAVEFTVTSKNGLMLRSDQSIDALILAKIPYGTKIGVCSPQYGNLDAVDGFDGKWVTAEYDGLSGYVYDAYIRLSEENIGLVIPDITLSPWIPNDVETLGIYRSESAEGQEYFQLRSATLEMEIMDDGEFDAYTLIQADSEVQPLFMVTGLEAPENELIDGISYDYKMLFPGEAIQYGYGNEQYLIYTEGELNRNDDESELGIYAGIKNYQFKIRGKVNGEIVEETLFEMDLNSWNGADYEGGVQLLWTGDVDADGKMDLLLTSSDHYACFSYHLFLSSKAEEGKLVKEVAREHFCGC